MKWLAERILRLYPARWRGRYGDEVRTLVEDAGADMRVVADLLKGAVRMQFSTWSFPRLAAVLGLVGMLLGAGMSLLTPTRYVARTEIALAGADSPVETLQMVRSRVTSRTWLSHVINDPRVSLYSDRLKTEPLEDVIELMRHDVEVNLDERGQIVIQFTYPDKSKVRTAVRDMANVADTLRGITEAAEGNQKPLYLDIIDTASLPYRPLDTNPWLGALIGLPMGLALALLLYRARRLRSASAVIRFALAGTLAGAAVAWFLPSIAWVLPDGAIPLRYQSRATLYAQSEAAMPVARMLAQINSRASLASIISDPRLRLYQDQLTSHELEDVAGKMRADLTVSSRGAGAGARWVDIAFTYSDPHKSQQTVQVVINRLQEMYDASTRGTGFATAPARKWGTLQLSGRPLVRVEAISPNRLPAVSYGLFGGFMIAGIIAAVRRRWRPEAEVITERQDAALRFESQSRPALRFDLRSFCKLAVGLALAGVAAGAMIAVRSPVHYTSDALVAFENMQTDRAAMLINETINRVWKRVVIEHGLYEAPKDGSLQGPEFDARLKRTRSDLRWYLKQADGAAAGAFVVQFASDSPSHARDVLQDVLGAIDQRLVELQGSDDISFESIRGVDGGLIPVSGPTTSTNYDSFSEELLATGKPGVALDSDLAAAPTVPPPTPAVSSGNGFVNHVPAQSIGPKATVIVPYDDPRAEPVRQPEYRGVRMNVIDSPSTASSSEGLGGWTIALGGAAGLLLASLVSFSSGLRGGLTAKSPGVIAGASLP